MNQSLKLAFLCHHNCVCVCVCDLEENAGMCEGGRWLTRIFENDSFTSSWGGSLIWWEFKISRQVCSHLSIFSCTLELKLRWLCSSVSISLESLHYYTPSWLHSEEWQASPVLTQEPWEKTDEKRSQKQDKHLSAGTWSSNPLILWLGMAEVSSCFSRRPNEHHCMEPVHEGSEPKLRCRP